MIQLIRVYKDGRVIAAEAYDHTEKVSQPDVPAWARLRCFPAPLWQGRMAHLAAIEYPDCKVTVTSIYRATN